MVTKRNEQTENRDGIGYAGLVAAYKPELDVLWHRLALENRRHLGRQRTATS